MTTKVSNQKTKDNIFFPSTNFVQKTSKDENSHSVHTHSKKGFFGVWLGMLQTLSVQIKFKPKIILAFIKVTKSGR